MKIIKLFLIILILLSASSARGVLAQTTPPSAPLLNQGGEGGGNSIYFQMPSAVQPDSEFTVSILVNTAKPINAFDLEIAYPQDQLRFVSYNNAHSIVDIWQTNPKLMTNGDIQMTGGILHSFSGQNGLIINLTFKALASQTAPAIFSFVKSNAYIADGKATPANLTAGNSSISINSTTPLSAPLLNQGGEGGGPPPKITASLTKSPVDNATLIVFQASDKESGIKQIQMRYKDWWNFSPWFNVQNPVLYPAGAWQIELRAESNAGLESVQSLFSGAEIFKKLLILFFTLFVIVFVFRRVYNDKT